MSDARNRPDLEAKTDDELVNEIHDATDRGDHQTALDAFNILDLRDLNGTQKH
ncbi:hypothetical protein [Streptomyces shenzhenensis]|uniref:hypothetical protein n=1 Tax=Streptomyces shenzhenensis TaxID=943815 RepID=UPI0036B54289